MYVNLVQPIPLTQLNFASILRCDAKLIKAVEANAEAVNGPCAKLKVVEIPEEATDWEINEYDGLESITYVVDGKLHHIS